MNDVPAVAVTRTFDQTMAAVSGLAGPLIDPTRFGHPNDLTAPTTYPQPDTWRDPIEFDSEVRAMRAWAKPLVAAIQYRTMDYSRQTGPPPATGAWSFHLDPWAMTVVSVEAMFLSTSQASVADHPNPDAFATVTVSQHASLLRAWAYRTGPPDAPGPEAERALYLEIWEAINRIESHERMEHFKVYGVPVFDPHPSGSSSPAPWHP